MVDWLKGIVAQGTEPWEDPSNSAYNDFKEFAEARRDKIKPQLDH
jgi:hypothetical protein